MIAMGISLAVIFALAFRVAVRALPRHRPAFWAGLAARLLGGVAVGVVYHYHYGLGDTLLFFEEGAKLAQLAADNPAAYLVHLWGGHVDSGGAPFYEPRTAFFIKLVSVVSLVTFANYWAASLWFSFVAFLCAWRLTQGISTLLPEGRGAAYLAFLFFPSVVFWGSGLIKEALALAALLYLSATVLKIQARQNVRWNEWLLSLVSVWVAWNLKYYWCLIFVAVAISLVAVQRLGDRYRWSVARSFTVWVAVFGIVVMVASMAHPNFYPHRLFSVIVDNYHAFQRAGGPSVVTYPHLHAHVWGVLSSAPLALVTGLFRPFVWEAHNALSTFSAIENFWLLAFVVSVPYRQVWGNATRWRLMMVAVSAYVILLAVFLALSTPNLGTLVRYRVGFLPFFVFLLAFANPWMRKLNERWIR